MATIKFQGDGHRQRSEWEGTKITTGYKLEASTSIPSAQTEKLYCDRGGIYTQLNYKEVHNGWDKGIPKPHQWDNKGR